MSKTLQTWVDASVGETRWALVDEGRPIALKVLRWSDAGRRARWGEAYQARVRSVDKRLRGAFVDLGLADEEGFLPLGFDGQARAPGGARIKIEEGMGLRVFLGREAARGKSPVVEVLGVEAGAPGRIDRHASDSDLDQALPAPPETRAALDAAFEAALSPTALIPGGGLLTIEPTAALVAIDVDAAGRKGSPQPDRFSQELNVAAAREALRQLRLRNLGGLAAIDFVAMQSAQAREAVQEALREAGKFDPWGPQFAPLSRFGVVELVRAQMVTPFHEQLCGADRAFSVETLGLMALRRIESAAGQARGRVVVLEAAPGVAGWLDASPALRAALSARIGTRWRVTVAVNPDGSRLETRLEDQ